MDGVLVDTEPFYHRQRLEFLRRMDYSPASTVHLVGSNEPEVWKTLVPSDLILRQELLAGYYAFRHLHPTPYHELLAPQALGLMVQLQRLGIRTGIASSSVRESIELMLAKTGLGLYIDYYISGEDCTAYKPAPEIYQKVLTALDLRPSEAFAVEDSTAGIAAAKSAGMRVYALRTPGQNQSAATAVIETLDELLQYL